MTIDKFLHEIKIEQLIIEELTINYTWQSFRKWNILYKYAEILYRNVSRELLENW